MTTEHKIGTFWQVKPGPLWTCGHNNIFWPTGAADQALSFSDGS